MASGKFQEFCEDIFLHFLVGTSQTVATAANVRIALCTGTAPNSNSIGTELSGATGYTAGGSAGPTSTLFGTVTQADPTIISNDEQVQWTNGGSTWTTITGVIIHRGGGTIAEATCMYFIDGLSVVVPAGATLTIAIGGLDVTEA